MRWDSLMVQCTVAALIYFVPQDIPIVAGMLFYWHNAASNSAPSKWHSDPAAALEDFKAKKGLDSADVKKGSCPLLLGMPRGAQASRS